MSTADPSPPAAAPSPALRLRVDLGHASRGARPGGNEDYFGVVKPEPDELRAKGITIAVADGVSGCSGRRAAEYVVRSVLSSYYGAPANWRIPLALERCIDSINGWLQAEAHRRPDLEGLATTLAVLVLREDSYSIAHVGDTRIYRLRGGRLACLTTDHVWPGRAMRHTLRRAVGLDDHAVVDYADGPLVQGDTYLLASDGVWEVLGDGLLLDVLQSGASAQQAAAELVDQSLARQRLYLGNNDATAVVARVEECG